MLKCLIIDDEELARTLLKTYANKIDFIEVVGTYENPVEALSIIKNKDIDLVFLDIQMPDLKGTVLASILPEKCRVIFTTAYAEYALEGFELNAVDYLLKPITFERFLNAVTKLQSNTSTNSDATLTIKSGYDLHKLKLNDITHIESDSEYVKFHTATKRIMSYQTLKSLEKTLDASIFMRVHRSYIINKTKVTGLKGRELLLSDIKIAVSDSYYEAVKKELF
jgi:DNA-binding LytR/AlgR family response regulator|tara:strand:- start:10457 stop:11125 length:669 start_codon:yes stop_codon:yes gene_type:complete